MKKLIITSMALLFTMISIRTAAQSGEDLAKAESKNTSYKEKEIRKEKKEERKALRKPEGNEVSEIAKTNFISDFGNIRNVHWKRGIQFDEATFTKDGKRMTAYYDYNSKLVGTTQNSSFNDIPLKAQNIIKKKYKGYSIGTVVFYDDNETNETDMILNNIQFDDADNYFVPLTKNGKTAILMVSPDGDISYFTTIK